MKENKAQFKYFYDFSSILINGLLTLSFTLPILGIVSNIFPPYTLTRSSLQSHKEVKPISKGIEYKLHTKEEIPVEEVDIDAIINKIHELLKKYNIKIPKDIVDFAINWALEISSGVAKSGTRTYEDYIKFFKIYFLRKALPKLYVWIRRYSEAWEPRTARQIDEEKWEQILFEIALSIPLPKWIIEEWIEKGYLSPEKAKILKEKGIL